MKINYSLAAAVLISTCAAFPALAQDAATQAILDANQRAAVQQVEQTNATNFQNIINNEEQARKSMSQNDNSGAIDLDRLFGLVQEPAPVAAAPQEAVTATHRHHHRRKHGS